MTDMEFNDLQQEVLDLYDTEEWQEGLYLEFKSSQGGLSKEFWPTYSAFANTNGGIIMLGVADDGTVEGLKNPEARHKELVDNLNNPQKCNVNLCEAEGMICTVLLDDKVVLAVRVPVADPELKPIYINGGLNNCYMRRYEADEKCKEVDLRRMLRDHDVVTSTHASADTVIIQDSHMDDLDETTLRQFRNRMKSASQDNAWLEDDDQTLLTKLGGFRIDRKTGEKGVTLAGLLMFGKSESINELFPQFQLDYFEYDGSEENDIIQRWSDRITNDGTWIGNLYQFFFKILPRLTENLKIPFRLNPDMTRQGESPAHVAVREAFANTLVHADYWGDCGIKIVKTPKGIDLINPGTLLMSKERMFEGGFSKCRNKSLQRMFQMMGIVDKAGSGIDKIVKGLWEQCLSLPIVHEKASPERIVWELPYLSLLPREKVEKLMQQIGKDKYAALSVHEKLILTLIPEDYAIGHKEIRTFLPLHPADLSHCLSKLTRNGYLKTEGVARATRYRLIVPFEWNIRSSTQSVELEDGNSTQSVELEDGNSTQSVEATLLESTKKVLGRKWIRRSDLEDAIKDLCAENWMTCIHMADLLGRSPRSLQQNILRPMVEHGLLDLKYPDNMNHPQQGYHTVASE
ncbi:MAG: putative DNA binding domain-containing protein [Akkermansia sp.]